MNRKESYLRCLAMQKRIEELKEIHHWDAKDLSFVQLAIDDSMPMSVHNLGSYILLSSLSAEIVSS